MAAGRKVYLQIRVLRAIPRLLCSHIMAARNTVMGDDPKKKKADSKRQSQQKHEVAYRKSKAKKSSRS
jgi:hypothetical protein